MRQAWGGSWKPTRESTDPHIVSIRPHVSKGRANRSQIETALTIRDIETDKFRPVNLPNKVGLGLPILSRQGDLGKKRASLSVGATDESNRSVSIPARRDSYRDECGMSILATVRSICVVLCLAGMATAQEPPPLEPPDPGAVRSIPGPDSAGRHAEARQCTAHETEAGHRGPAENVVQPAPARPESGPMLAIPGRDRAEPTSPARASPPRAGMSPFSFGRRSGADALGNPITPCALGLVANPVDRGRAGPIAAGPRSR